MKERKIKYAIETFVDHPAPWSDEEIDKYMKKSMWDFFIPNIMWCHNNEELFDNPCKCKGFIETPLKKGHIRIKYACEEIKYVPYDWSREYIQTILKGLAEYQNGRSFIWCYGDDELFKE